MTLHDTPLIDALLFILLLIPAVILHEVAHGFVAFRLGDTTARDAGRLTLNPIRHVDPVGSLLVPGILAASGQNVFGWARPVPVNPSGFARPVEGMAVTALAGPATNLLLALVVGRLGPFQQVGDTVYLQDGGLATRLLLGFVVVNAALAVFNMLPIPPLDGSRLLPLVLPPAGRRLYARLAPYGFLILLALVFVFEGALSFLSDWIRWLVQVAV
ncbi:MAG TPA: site-2 protease family protein [Actinobacteria bacterium]|nr:site-2 protease family protein [Actinomycetota bacterium]